MHASVPDRSSGSPAQRIIGIYLNDHLAGATVGVELTRRMVQEHRQSPYGSDLENLATEISQDRQALLGLMAAFKVPVRRYKVGAAWAGEKIGRLKPNGRLRRRSGLSILIELEGLRLGVEGKALLWRTLLASAVHDPRVDADQLKKLLQRAQKQRELLDSMHGRATSTLVAPDEPHEPKVDVAP